MCPEPDFGLCYHSLMEYYRPSPETSREEISTILERYFKSKQEKETEQRRTPPLSQRSATMREYPDPSMNTNRKGGD